MTHLRTAYTIFVVAFSVLILQLVQTRIFSVIFWNHLVYFIVSIALLGFGIAGTLISLTPRWPGLRRLTVDRSIHLFVVSVLFSSFFATRASFQSQLFLESLRELLRMLVTYSAAILPYFFAGWILGTIYRDRSQAIHRLYLIDLLGAGLGCLAYLVFMPRIGAILLVLLSCGLVLSATLSTSGKRPRAFVLPAILFAILFVLALRHESINRSIQPEITKGYGLNYANLPPGDEKVIEISEWSAISRIDVVSRRLNPGEKRIYIDGDAWTGLLDHPSEPAPRLDFAGTDSPTSGLAAYFFLPTVDSVLVIGSGGGVDVWNALRAGATHVDAAELNATTARIGVKEYADFTNGLFTRPGVNLVHAEGRSFLRRSKTPYDVIMIQGTDTYAATGSGAYMFSESYLYTKDAIKDYLRHLSPRGMLSISRWYHKAELVRLLATVLDGLSALGIPNPEHHVVITQRDDQMPSILARLTPFTSNELTALHEALRTKETSRLLYPPADINSPHLIHRILLDFVKARSSGTVESFYASYPYDVRPVSDDNPFFFNHEKWTHILSGFKAGGDWILYRGNWPTLTLWTVFFFALISVVLFMGLPLFLTRSTYPQGVLFAPYLIYFAAIGAGFIFVEITLMQRFALLLGHPAHSLAVVLGSLLITSGIGSYASPSIRIPHAFRLFSLAVLILMSIWVYPAFANGALAWPFHSRALLVIALIAPLGFLMGTAFPTGIRQVASVSDQAVPWMWGVNGGSTVLGSVTAIILAICLGFSTVLSLGALFYLVAGLAYFRLQKSE